MSNNFFREGCPAELTHGRKGEGEDAPFYVDTMLYFQSEGRILKKEDAGKVEPDAIRVVPVDDYGSSTYRDRVYAFSKEAAAAENESPQQIPEGNIVVLEQSAVDFLDGACGSCTSVEGCAFLKTALGRTLGIEE